MIRNLAVATVTALALTAAPAVGVCAVVNATTTTDQPDQPGTGRLAPCQYEDSTGCVWDARDMGNGAGRSYVVTPDGRVIYLPHYAAHALVFGGK